MNSTPREDPAKGELMADVLTGLGFAALYFVPTGLGLGAVVLVLHWLFPELGAAEQTEAFTVLAAGLVASLVIAIVGAKTNRTNHFWAGISGSMLLMGLFSFTSKRAAYGVGQPMSIPILLIGQYMVHFGAARWTSSYERKERNAALVASALDENADSGDVDCGPAALSPEAKGGLATIPRGYAEYLKSAHWRQIRERALDRAGRRCQLCNAGGVTLNVHHRTYAHLGAEGDTDLIVLCEACHEVFHERRRVAR